MLDLTGRGRSTMRQVLKGLAVVASLFVVLFALAALVLQDLALDLMFGLLGAVTGGALVIIAGPS
jgi:hypothetical protein